ncbi:hypothetical protein [Frankia sp. CcWB3]
MVVSVGAGAVVGTTGGVVTPGEADAVRLGEGVTRSGGVWVGGGEV